MNTWTLARRSLWHYRRSNLAVFAGLAISATVLVGALTVGDSVQYSLDRIALDRIGQAHHAVVGQDRFFRADLANRLAAKLGTSTAPVLLFNGHAVLPDGSGRANDVQVLGVDDRFWDMAPQEGSVESGPTGLVMNDHLAARLGVAQGDAVVVRMGKPSDLPGDAPLSGEQGTQVSWRGKVATIVDDTSFGRFGLQADQVAPYNLFVPLKELQERVEQEGRANLVLVGGDTPEGSVRDALQDVWRIEDAGLSCTNIPARGQVEMRSKRVFIDPPVVRAALALRPTNTDLATRPLPVVTYLVNTLAAGTNSTPYSMVSALPLEAWPGLGGKGVPPDGMIVNAWLAKDLGVGPGDSMAATYFLPGPMGTLIETGTSFRIHAVVPIEGAANDPDLMPGFPGLAESDSCRTWEPGFALDLDRIRDQDEAYWDEHRGTPKAFIPLEAGTNLWHNRFGTYTAIRYPRSAYSTTDIEEGLRRALRPSEVGLQVEPIRQTALAASGQAMGFGGLFLGLSMFLLASALMLSGMLFAFGTLRRAGETGLRLAVGFLPGAVRAAYLREGMLIAVAATAVGSLAGTAYTRLLLHALSTVWQGAVGQTTLLYHAGGSSILTGAMTNVAAAMLTMDWVVRRQAKQPVHTLLSTGGQAGRLATGRRSRGKVSLMLAAVCAAGAIAAVALTVGTPGSNAAPTFFAAGALLLGAGMFLCGHLLRTTGEMDHPERLTGTRLVLLGLARRRGRSLGTIAMLACGTFMVVGVGASRPDLRGSADARQSGTGGFNYLAELSQPITKDLNTPEGRAEYGMEEDLQGGSSFAQARVRAGDDASCLNLNRAQQPRLLGIDPAALAGRFTFTAVHPDFEPGDDPWEVLSAEDPEGRIPGVVDQNSLLWAMGKKLGDTVTYTDASGKPFEVVLVGSLAGGILQGSVIIGEDRFLGTFPSSAGYRVLLADTTGPTGSSSRSQDALYAGLEDFGVSVQHTEQRLAELNEVQNTYLSMFLLLGGLGLILGTVGLGAAVLRNVMERQRELGVLRALGFSKDRIHGMIVSEHLALLLAGFVCGLVAALVGVMPSLLAPGTGVPYVLLGVITAGILLNGLWWTFLAARWSLRGSMLEGLRGE